MKNAVVLISGNGSNLGSLIDNAKDIGIHISAVISNKSDAYGLIRADNANIFSKCIMSKGVHKKEFEESLIREIDNYMPDMIILAGFMKTLSVEFIMCYQGKILNIHPSLLPKFKGLDTHKRVLETNDKIHGATVHIVSSELDSGEIILQKSLAILPNDTPECLAERVLKLEHTLYPQAIKLFINNYL